MCRPDSAAVSYEDLTQLTGLFDLVTMWPSCITPAGHRTQDFCGTQDHVRAELVNVSGSLCTGTTQSR